MFFFTVSIEKTQNSSDVWRQLRSTHEHNQQTTFLLFCPFALHKITLASKEHKRFGCLVLSVNVLDSNWKEQSQWTNSRTEVIEEKQTLTTIKRQSHIAAGGWPGRNTWLILLTYFCSRYFLLSLSYLETIGIFPTVFTLNCTASAK